MYPSSFCLMRSAKCILWQRNSPMRRTGGWLDTISTRRWAPKHGTSSWTRKSRAWQVMCTWTRSPRSFFGVASMWLWSSFWITCWTSRRWLRIPIKRPLSSSKSTRFSCGSSLKTLISASTWSLCSIVSPPTNATMLLIPSRNPSPTPIPALVQVIDWSSSRSWAGLTHPTTQTMIELSSWFLTFVASNFLRHWRSVIWFPHTHTFESSLDWKDAVAIYLGLHSEWCRTQNMKLVSRHEESNHHHKPRPCRSGSSLTSELPADLWWCLHGWLLQDWWVWNCNQYHQLSGTCGSSTVKACHMNAAWEWRDIYRTTYWDVLVRRRIESRKRFPLHWLIIFPFEGNLLAWSPLS